jgi:hypothetical protein
VYLKVAVGGNLQRPEGGAATITSATSPAARQFKDAGATVIAHTQAKERLPQLKDPHGEVIPDETVDKTGNIRPSRSMTMIISRTRSTRRPGTTSPSDTSTEKAGRSRGNTVMDRPACRTTCLLRSQNRSARAGCDGLSRLDTSTKAQRRKPSGAASFEMLENSHTVSRNRGRSRRVVTLASYAPTDRFVIFARAGGCAPFFIAAPIGILSTISDDFSICDSR